MLSFLYAYGILALVSIVAVSYGLFHFINSSFAYHNDEVRPMRKNTIIVLFVNVRDVPKQIVTSEKAE